MFEVQMECGIRRKGMKKRTSTISCPESHKTVMYTHHKTKRCMQEGQVDMCVVVLLLHPPSHGVCFFFTRIISEFCRRQRVVGLLCDSDPSPDCDFSETVSLRCVFFLVCLANALFVSHPLFSTKMSLLCHRFLDDA